MIFKPSILKSDFIPFFILTSEEAKHWYLLSLVYSINEVDIILIYSINRVVNFV